MFGWSELTPVLPELIILGTACLVLILSLFLSNEKGGLLVMLSIVGIAFAAIATAKSHMGAHDYSKLVLFNGNFVRDYMGDILKIAVYLTMIFVIVYSNNICVIKKYSKASFTLWLCLECLES